MFFFYILAVLFLFFSSQYSSLLSATLMYFFCVLSLVPQLGMDWRSFFLAWAYISGVFILLVYAVAFVASKKNSFSYLMGAIFLFLFLYSFPTEASISLEHLYSPINLFAYSQMIFFCFILLPVISYIFGPTVSCRKGLE